MLELIGRRSVRGVLVGAIGLRGVLVGAIGWLFVGCGGGGNEGGDDRSPGAGGSGSATASGGCATAPDCGSCGGCFASCFCMTGNVMECQNACGTGAGGSGPGAGGIGNTGNVGSGGTGTAGAGGTGTAGAGGTGAAGTGPGGMGGTGSLTPPGTCAGKICGSDHNANQFCGPSCPKGQGCNASGQCGPWSDIDIHSIYDGASEWQLPPCSYSDDPGANLESSQNYAWIKTMYTLATDCPQVIQDLHPMAKPGNVVPEDQGVYVNGSCVEYSDGQWGTAHDGIIVWGQSWPGYFQGITYTINWRAIIDHNLPTPKGKGYAHLSGLPGDFACTIEMDVTYERCPDHRNDCGNHPVPY